MKTRLTIMLSGLLLLFGLAACSQKPEAGPAPAAEGQEVSITVDRYILAGEARPLGVLKSAEDWNAFREAYQKADKINNEEAMVAPDYEVRLKQGDRTDEWNLWIAPPGKPGLIMDMSDTSASYRTTAEANEDLRRRIARIPYGSKQAKRFGDVSSGPSGLTHIEKWTAFLEQVERQQPASVQVTKFTDEGDPIFHNLDYDGSRIHYAYDNSLDGFGTPDKKQDTCRRLAGEPTANNPAESRTTYTLEGCDGSGGERFGFVVEQADLKTTSSAPAVPAPSTSAEAVSEEAITIWRGLSREIEPDRPFYGRLTNDESLRDFREAYSTATPINADLDTEVPDYEVSFPIDGNSVSAHLWLNGQGKAGMLHDVNDPSGRYLRLTSQAAGRLWAHIMKLPYDAEQAGENGDIVIRPSGEQINEDRWTDFRSAVDSGKKAYAQIVAYTIEGDPIFYDLNYDGSVIRFQYDNTHDAFGTADRQFDTCKKIVEVPMEEVPGTKVLLDGCSSAQGGRNDLFTLRFPTEPAHP
ncbi:hypothetical protein CDO73_02020 [Saccharibacillus sp. O23]|uniref:DUF4362 domain-containing protein n=1 Tax=Saccharibacillus sp. O23 TaxID=2009338 RepID=UPI000B4E49D6|nr:DUF4362 domain-containing protein [Saccharibacillus sp. O23]OWR32407.1 hypothetical protein CDO73_02020 [Saccharibacillus sp. O23]